MRPIFNRQSATSCFGGMTSILIGKAHTSLWRDQVYEVGYEHERVIYAQSVVSGYVDERVINAQFVFRV